MMRESQPHRQLADLVDLVNDRIVVGKDGNARYVGLENLVSRSPDLATWSAATTSISTNGVFREGDTLFGKLRPNLRKCVLTPFDGYCSTDILVLRAREGIAPRFASRVLQSDAVFDAAILTAVGTKMPRTSWHALRHLAVFAPPLPEQRQIAAILDTIDDAIRKTEQIIAKLKQVKQGLLHDLLTRGIDDNGELRDPERHPEQFKDSPLGRVPKGWEVRVLGSLTKVTVGHVGPIEQFFTDADHGLPLVSTSHIGEDGDLDGPMRRISDAFDLSHSKSRVLSGDIVVARHGASGSAAQVPESIPRAQSLNVVIVRQCATLLPDYLTSVLNHPAVRRRLLGGQAGSVQAIVGTKGVASLPIALAPVHEQHLIAEKQRATSQSIAVERGALAKLRLLKQGLMEDLLTGRVRVTSLLAETPP